MKYFSSIDIKSNIHLFYFLQHEAIHAYVQAFNASYITDRIEIGSIYKSSNFYVETNKDTFRTVDRPTRIIFSCGTVFVPITKDVPNIAFNKFWFIDFDQVQSRIATNEVLTDNL